MVGLEDRGGRWDWRRSGRRRLSGGATTKDRADDAATEDKIERERDKREEKV